MSVADLYDLELIWPSLGPTNVIVTGTFDQWSSSIHLVKGDTGFFGIVKVPWGQKVAYKFIVDGRWRCRDDRPQEDDGGGNINNVLQTPEEPELAIVHDPPTRLSIPFDGPSSEGYGDIENMVTAVEFFPPAEPPATKWTFPLPIPQITVEGLVQVPSPVNESRPNTAAATEGHISPASVTGPAEVTPFKQASASYDVPILPLNDSDSDPLPPINGNGEASDGFGTHAPIQIIEAEPPTSPSVPEAVEVVVTPSESAVPSHSPEATQVNVPPTAVLAPTAKQRGVDSVETSVRSHPRQAAAPASSGRASTPSTPASSTLTPKKRRSLFARIKHIFDKNKDKQEGKENKH